jgi:hypothetical protein
MPTVKQAAAEFLAHKRVAVTGVSRTPQGHGSNVVYQRLRQRGYEVFAVNPEADRVEGDTCYPDLSSISGGVTGWSSEPGPRPPGRPSASAPAWASRGSGCTEGPAREACHIQPRNMAASAAPP